MAKGKGGSGRTINVFHVIFDRKSCHVCKLLQSSSKVLGPKIHLNQVIRYNSMADKRQRWPFLVLHFQNKPRTQSGNRVFNVNALDESSKPKLFLLFFNTCSELMRLTPLPFIHEDSSFEKTCSSQQTGCLLHVDDMMKILCETLASLIFLM